MARDDYNTWSEVYVKLYFPAQPPSAGTAASWAGLYDETFLKGHPPNAELFHEEYTSCENEIVR